MNPSLSMTDRAFEQFSATLDRSGLRATLAGLLEMTDFRFIAIFRFRGDKANAAVFYDREQPDVTAAVEVPAKATYCYFARDSDGAFTTGDALQDARLSSHPAREAVQSYCGVPVMTAEGELLGSLCHYDVVPRDPAGIDFELILRVASLLAYRGLVPPYPSSAT